MLPKDIPDFIEAVLEQIEIGIDRVVQKKLIAVEPPAGVDPPVMAVAFPEYVELMLNVDAHVDDDSVDGSWENQSLWVKIPWPKRIG